LVGIPPESPHLGWWCDHDLSAESGHAEPVRRAIAITLAVIAVVVVGFFVFASLYADWLWYDQLGFSSVLWTQWTARVIMFVVGFLAMAVPVFIAIQLAYRLRPVYARLTSQLDHYQEVVEPLRRLAMWGIPVFFGFFAGFAASAQWETAWLWFNRVDTGDSTRSSRWTRVLPVLAAVLQFRARVRVGRAARLAAALGARRLSVRVGARRAARAAHLEGRAHPARGLAGLYLLVQGVSIWLDRYKTLTQQSDRITGASYVDDHAVIPGLTIIAIAAAIVAVLFFVTAIIGRWRFPLIGVGLLVVSPWSSAWRTRGS
jgi:uncharacterized membrane protein (UPF0182 family)